jgi:dUTP pyrophosphatase
MKKQKVKINRTGEHIVLPKFESEFAAGMDIYGDTLKGYYNGDSEVLDMEKLVLESGKMDKFIMAPHSRVLVGTGLFVELPKDTYLAMVPRSGKSLKTGIAISNAPGTIDSDYKGEIHIIITNTNNTRFTLNIQEKLAQIILKERITWDWDEIKDKEEFVKTERGENGFGSTDVDKTTDTDTQSKPITKETSKKDENKK